MSLVLLLGDWLKHKPASATGLMQYITIRPISLEPGTVK